MPRKPTTPPEKPAPTYESKLMDILTNHQVTPETPVDLTNHQRTSDGQDEDRHFALSLVPMLQRLTEEEKYFAKVSMLNALRFIRQNRGIQSSPYASWPPYCVSGMAPVHMPGQTYVQPSSGHPQVQSNGRNRVPVHNMMPVQLVNGQPVISNGQHQMPVQLVNGQPVISNGQHQVPRKPAQPFVYIPPSVRQQPSVRPLCLPVQPNGQPEVNLQSNGQLELNLQSNGQPEVNLQSNGQLEVNLQSNGQPEVHSPSNDQPEVHSESNGLPKISMLRSLVLKRPSSPSPPAFPNVRVKVERVESPEVVVYSVDSSPPSFPDTIKDAS